MVTAPRSPTIDPSDRAGYERRALHALIKARWSKFTDFELEALADNADLINQVALKYGLGLPRAQTEVERLLKGRRV